MGEKDLDFTANTDKDLPNEPGFDITTELPGETPKEKEWDISVPVENKSSDEQRFNITPEEKKTAESDPFSAQPEWFKGIREGLSSAPEQMSEEAEKVVAEMPEKERVSLTKGLLGFGYRVQEFKGKTFSKAFTWAAEKFEKKSFGNRLFESYGEIYDNLANRARADHERFNEEGGIKKGMASAAMLAGNVLMYGRIVADAGFANPLRNVTAAAMALGRGGEAVKEAHLKSEEVIEEGRVHDIDVAENEAWKLYEEAKEKSKDKTVTKEHLIQTYKERLPQDIVDRLARDAGTEGFIAKCAQWVAHKDIARSAQKIQNKLNEIENNTALSKEEKENAKAHIAARYDTFLRDMDHIVGNGGAVDMIAYGSRLVEKGGKATAAAMALETLGEGIWRGAEAFGAFETGINEVEGELLKNVPVKQNNEDAIKEVFGSFSEKMTEEGAAPDDVALAEQASALGLGAENFDTFQGDPVQLSYTMTGVQELSIGGNESNIMKAIIAYPEVAEKLDNADVKYLLSNEEMSFGREEEILNAENVAVVGKNGSISEALGVSMPPDATVMVVNPDGTMVENFDANLVHQGDTVVQNHDGTITVFKTSDIEVRAGHSLQGVYDEIKQGLDEKGIPSEVQNALNQGEGHWDGQISRAEAREMEETWDSLKTNFDTLDEEGKRAFLGKLSKGMERDEISAMLQEQLAVKQEIATTPNKVIDLFNQQTRPEQWRTIQMYQNDIDAMKENLAKFEDQAVKESIEKEISRLENIKTSLIGSLAEQTEQNTHIDAPDEDFEDFDENEQTEIPSREVAPPERLPETIPHVENADSFTVEKSAEHEYSYKGREGDFKGKFSYNENNEVTGFRHEGGIERGKVDEVRNSVLKEGWKENIPGKGSTYLTAQRNIEITSGDLGIKQRILKAMEKAGDKETKEYLFLKKSISTSIDTIEKKYGDVFK